MATQAPVTDDTSTELDSLNDLLDQQQKKRDRDEARAPKGFEPSALFLLTLGYENLFDPTGQEHLWTCRGCGDTVKRWERSKHFDRHKRAADRGDIRAKEERMGKGATQAAREQREARAQSRSQATKDIPAVEAKPVKETAEKPAQKSAARSGWKPTNTEASRAILDTLIKRLTKKLPKGAKLETKANDNVGYTSIKVNDKLIGYGWLTGKAQLRLEVAIEVKEVPPIKDAPVVLLCKRSQTMRARTVLADQQSDFDLGVGMLMVAAAKWADVK